MVNLLIKNALNKSIQTDVNENATNDELFNIILQKFPNYESVHKIKVDINGKSLIWSEEIKSSLIKNHFGILSSSINRVFVAFRVDGGLKPKLTL
jgi:hypothetical protein